MHHHPTPHHEPDRFVPNPFPKDPPALSPVALLNPRETATLQERLAHGWELVLRRTEPEHDHDFTVYTGTAGIGFLGLHTVQLMDGADPRRPPFVQAAQRYLLGAQAQLERHLRHGGREDITFLLGTPGVYAPLAVFRQLEGKPGAAVQECIQRVLDLARLFLPVAEQGHGPQDGRRSGLGEYPYEVLYGASGYLTSLLYLKQHFPLEVPAMLVHAVVHHILEGAEDGPGGALLWQWHGKDYLGAAHGVSGILLALLDVHAHVGPLPQEVRIRIHATLEYLHSLRLPSGNYPTRPTKDEADHLVQWCHGAPGVLLLFVRAYESFAEPKYLAWAESAADVVWTRGLLTKGNGLCHGVAGNAYCFLSLYRAAGNDIYLHRARVFALAAQDDFLTQHQGMPDHPYSLFEGHAGLLMLYADLVLGDPRTARFPAVEMGGSGAGAQGKGVEEEGGEEEGGGKEEEGEQ